MNSLKFGSYQAVNNCIKLQAQEKVVIITDKETVKIAKSIQDEVEKISKNSVLFVMEDFGERPEDGSNPLQLPTAIITALQDAQVSVYVAETKKGELASFRIPLFDVLEQNHVRHAHMIRVTEHVMCTGMSVDYAKVQEVTKKVYDYVQGAEKIHVTTKKGTDFIAEMDSKYKWIICDGNVIPNKVCNLPGGEIFTHPANFNGVYIVDGVLGEHFNLKYGALDKHPLTITVRDSIITSISSSNKELQEDFEAYIAVDENANRIGELGIGTNIFLDEFSGVMVQDEKYPGIHVAVGDGYSKETGCEYTSRAHCDGIIRDTTIKVDDKYLMKDGTFIFE